MRIGLVVLPQQRWAEAASRWRAVEEMGFDHAWTYDHLAWGDLVDEPWFATVPTLVAAATVTSRIRLGTWVASPNFRHPVAFAKELMTLDDVSGGRVLLGLGAGGTGWDADVLGVPQLTPGRRMERFTEFVELLDLLLTQPVTDYDGTWYRAVQARLLPGCIQQPRPPFVVAANGPKGMAVAARHGQGWATNGPEGVDGRTWWQGVAGMVEKWRAQLAAHGRRPEDVDTYLSVDTSEFSLSSVDHFEDVVGRARDLGFSDVVAHWPRAEGVYAGSESVLEQAAGRLDALRAG
jgi:alkanesulfonate monooxygenase SsuD/methylene tetrahydromethanopterin reductase-like flavin-dependent oxidoreductase (luciferase family)